MKNLIILFTLLSASIIVGCGQKNTPESVVADFFENSKHADSSEALKSYLTGEAAVNLDKRFQNLKSMHENYEVSLSILETADQDDGSVRLKAKIVFVDESGKGSMNEVFTLLKSEGEWSITKIGGPFEDLDFDELEDGQGKTPFDYADIYFEAMNQGNTEKIKNLYSEGYFTSIVTRRGLRDERDPSLWEKHIDRKIKRTESYEINEAQCGFHENNAEGVYSASYKITMTEEFAKEFGEKFLKGRMPSKTGGMEICFRLENGVWRITDKLKGY